MVLLRFMAIGLDLCGSGEVMVAAGSFDYNGDCPIGCVVRSELRVVLMMASGEAGL